MYPPSLLTGDNAAFLDAWYKAWLDDPNAVPAAWRELFEQWDVPSNGHGNAPGTVPRWPHRSIFHAHGSAGYAAEGVPVAEGRQAKVVQLINTYRVRGHMKAQIDPLNRRDKVIHPELTLEYYGLEQADLDATVSSHPLYGLPERVPLRQLVHHLEEVYCGSIASEFMNINSLEEKYWVIEQLETLPHRQVLSREEELRILRKLSDAENFERLLHTRFPGTKRFSLEGSETLIPLLDLAVEHAGMRGVKEIVVGMAHRGRLNTLANILEKPVSAIIDEFQDQREETYQGSGDVKYHLGYSADVKTVRGDGVHLSLAFNPSHLEAVDPVVEGRVRAKQDRARDVAHETGLALLVHGDAAFSGQGVVSEVLNLSQLPGYRTGGTLHVIVNNQIGFTTPPAEGRSTPYATDVARMLGIPIFHVNGEDPRAVAAVVQIAAAWRQRFRKDVVIDMYCYRKHGHNEGDEPSFTQPLMYEEIRSRPTPREVFAKHLVDEGHLTTEECERIDAESRARMEGEISERPAESPRAQALRSIDTKEVTDEAALFLKEDAEPVQAGERDYPDLASPLKGLWTRYLNGSIHDEVDTGVDLDRLRDLLVRSNTLPEGFHAHPKIQRLLKARREAAEGKRALDWATAEQAAFATLVTDGYRVRLAGQDSGRGTFSQRHAVLTDIQTGEEYFPLKHLAQKQGEFSAIDSSLSEAGVLGFEYGYSLDTPDALVIWEAQFGDFANGGQVIIDNFVVSGEQKWQRLSGLTLFLPHGYEGQGPEHSSAKMERWLQLCAQDNIQLANCTTPGNLFHLLRRQTIRAVRKPLVLFTPKSLLRHPDATSALEELANGRFQRLIDDPGVDPSDVRRVVLCQGKVYYDLLAARREREERRVALVRVELLYPYPKDRIDEVLARYPEAEVVWCQEEPRNRGAWPSYLQRFVDHLGAAHLPRYVGRPQLAAPSGGSHRRHEREQHALVDEALTL